MIFCNKNVTLSPKIKGHRIRNMKKFSLIWRIKLMNIQSSYCELKIKLHVHCIFDAERSKVTRPCSLKLRHKIRLNWRSGRAAIPTSILAEILYCSLRNNYVYWELAQMSIGLGRDVVPLTTILCDRSQMPHFSDTCHTHTHMFVY